MWVCKLKKKLGHWLMVSEEVMKPRGAVALLKQVHR